MLAGVFEQSMDCIKLLGIDGVINYMSRNGRRALEMDEFSQLDPRPWWALWPAQSSGLIKQAIERAVAGESVRIEAFCPTAKGSPRWWDVSVSPLRDASGALQGLISVSRDITQRVQERELRETTAAEMRHRLQNAYSLAGALVNSAARGQPELNAFAADVLERLSKLGAAQRLLLESGDGGAVPLRDLLDRLMQPFGSPACAIDITRLPALLLSEDDVRTLALVVGELCTNSNKYGAMGFGGSLTLGGAVKDNMLALRWAERLASEAPAGQKPGSSGSGHRLVNRALAGRGGAMAIEWRKDGLDVTVTLPVRD